MKVKKLVLTTFAVFMACGILTACNSEDKKVEKIATCKSALDYNVRYKFEFVLDKDEKTIKEIRYIQGMNEENLKKVYPDKNLEETYKAFKDDFEWQYQTATQGNEKLVWFKSKLDVTPDKHFAELRFVFDVANKDLDMKDKDTVDFITQFGIHQFYNEDEKAFLYDANKFQSEILNHYITKPECTISEQK